MAVNLQAVLDAPIIEIDTIDSTNNYAMQLIDADTALPGTTIAAKEQTGGKGQRGRVWTDSYGESLLMSLITVPEHSISQQFIFNACVATAIVDELLNIYENWDVKIKWPNDIIINDKKAGGILIENVLRGSRWAYAIIGFGMNVNQEQMDAGLPYATSLCLAANKTFDIEKLRGRLRNKILLNLHSNIPAADVIQLYNEYLYRKDKVQSFTNGQEEWMAIIEGVSAQGQLQVQTSDGNRVAYTHGAVSWNWDKH